MIFDNSCDSVSTDNKSEALRQGGEARSSLVSRNITILGRRTSVRLEPEMWSALREISRREKCTIHDLCTLVSVRKNPTTSLTAAIRVFLMLYFRAAANEEGHARAGHGNFDFMKQRARIPQSILPILQGDSKTSHHTSLRLVEEAQTRSEAV